MGFSGDRLIDSQGEIETLDYTWSLAFEPWSSALAGVSHLRACEIDM